MPGPAGMTAESRFMEHSHSVSDKTSLRDASLPSEKKNMPNDSSIEKSAPSQDDNPETEQNGSSLPSFASEVMCDVRNSLGKLIEYTQTCQKKHSENGLSESFSRILSEAENINVLLDWLLKFYEMATPVRKTNTVHNLIEKVLAGYQRDLEEKEILVFRRFEENLPEVRVQDEDLGHMVGALLQYALALMPNGAGIGISTRSITHQREKVKGDPSPTQDNRLVEISVSFTGYRRPEEKSAQNSGAQTSQTEKKAPSLILGSIKDIVDKSRGSIKLEADDKKAKAGIFLVLPVGKDVGDPL